MSPHLMSLFMTYFLLAKSMGPLKALVYKLYINNKVWFLGLDWNTALVI